MRFIDLSFILQIDTEETICDLNMSHLKIYFILFHLFYFILFIYLLFIYLFLVRETISERNI